MSDDTLIAQFEEVLGKDASKKESQATRLIRLALDAGAELFHDGDDGYATIRTGGHRETFAIDSKAAKLWLRHLYYVSTVGAVSAQAVADAIAVLSARARFDGDQQTVSLRTAWHDRSIYIDLADESWRAVEVTPSGWRVVDVAPVRFRRAGGMRSLPAPVQGGDPMEVGHFLNISDTDDCRLCLSWLVGSMYPDGPYAILILNGEQGAAKSFSARVLRRLIDPNKSELRSEPRSVEDLMIAATNSLVLSFDNVSSLRPWLSDALCRLATGGGFSTRTLYENSDETIFEAQRPIILNGIEDFATRDDLIDRAMVITLPEIPEGKRKAEAEVWREFDDAHPRLFGAILDALVVSLREGDVHLDRMPRMADFAKRAYAAAPALDWTGADFLKAYTANRKHGAEASIEASVAVSALVSIVKATTEITATPGALLLSLNQKIEEKQRPKEWPSTPRAMTGLLTRYAPALRRNGIAVEQLERTGNERRWKLALKEATEPSQPSQPLPADSEPGDGISEADRRKPSPDRHRPTQDPDPPEPERDGSDGDDGIGGQSSLIEEYCECGGIVSIYGNDGTPYCVEHAHLRFAG